ncbi:cyclin-like protein [Tilletiaria anomala UBC 951]|uniref:Transcription initiation factor IIB n=1 Tax=Tilletiaria anomala (strain ATCC 24038 / CBS 436.72 / UBC 951) TaxID=1037660 RepID=A0A066WAA2_TILAU|nr:cyclin-like protein [Tilletiaria anomala UBC 951]KDN50847.1 cyclin-like protein [Tilletiaria anomala UBC 951]
MQYERPAGSSFQKPFALTAQYARDRGDEIKEQSFAPNLNVRLICPDCQVDPPNLSEEFSSGDLVCATCGLVVGDRIVDTRSEWRTFANEDGDDPSRVGESSNPILDGLVESLDTRIGARDGGSGISRQLQKTAQLGHGTQNRNILEAFDDIQRKCDSIHLPKMVSDTAKQLFRRAEESKVAKGKKTEAIVASAIYVACKINKVPRTFPEICNLTKVKKKLIGQVFREMQAAFGLNAPGTADGSVDAVGPTKALELVGRFCSRLGLENSIIRLTEDIVTRVREAGILAGKSPITISAACILFSVTLAMSNPPTAKQIAESAQVSDSTIKGSYREMLKSKSAVLSKDFLDKHKKIVDVNRLSNNH